MDKTILIAQLPPGTSIPLALGLLCDFTEETGSDSLGGGIALTPNGPDDLAAWVRLAPTLAASLFVFARDESHALFACWMHDTHDLEACPVARLNSEGVDNCILAADPKEFAWQIAEGSEAGGNGQPAPALRAWLAPRLPRATQANKPEMATDAALEAWIDAAIAAALDPGSSS